MEISGEYFVTRYKIKKWQCPKGVDFAHALGEMGTNHLHSMFAINAFVKHRDV